MPYEGRFQQTGTILGEVYSQVATKTSGQKDGAMPSVAAAKSGSLTTRTDANTGVLTITGSPFIEGDVIDLFWSTGQRRGMVVGEVTGDTYPIDLGAGDDLPAAATVITAMKPDVREISIDGDEAVLICVKCPASRGYIAFIDEEDNDIKLYTFEAAGGFAWAEEAEVANPLAGAIVAKIAFSHSASSGPQVMKAEVLYGAV